MDVALRAYADTDLALTLELETDPVAMSELGGPRPREALERVHRIRWAGSRSFVIEADGESVGSIFVWEGEHDGAAIHEIGWMVVPRAHGQGIATSALRLVLDRLGADSEVTGLHAFPGATNVASIRLCDRFGFDDLGEVEVDFGEHLLPSRHRVLQW